MRLHSDVIAAAALTLFCAAAFILTLGFEELPPALTPSGMGPKAFPHLLLGVLVAMLGALAWAARHRSVERQPSIPAVVWLTGLGVVGYLALLPFLGMTIANVVAIIGLGRLWGERRWSLLVASGVGLAIGLHLVFTRQFGMVFPSGAFGPLPF